jgi:hypothetical protein
MKKFLTINFVLISFLMILQEPALSSGGDKCQEQEKAVKEAQAALDACKANQEQNAGESNNNEGEKQTGNNGGESQGGSNTVLKFTPEQIDKARNLHGQNPNQKIIIPVFNNPFENPAKCKLVTPSGISTYQITAPQGSGFVLCEHGLEDFGKGGAITGGSNIAEGALIFCKNRNTELVSEEVLNTFFKEHPFIDQNAYYWVNDCQGEFKTLCDLSANCTEHTGQCSCTDSDGGTKPDEKGYTCHGYTKLAFDICTDANHSDVYACYGPDCFIRERVCSSTEPSLAAHTGSGFSPCKRCEDGACIEQ